MSSHQNSPKSRIPAAEKRLQESKGDLQNQIQRADKALKVLQKKEEAALKACELVKAKLDKAEWLKFNCCGDCSIIVPVLAMELEPNDELCCQVCGELLHVTVQDPLDALTRFVSPPTSSKAMEEAQTSLTIAENVAKSFEGSPDPVLNLRPVKKQKVSYSIEDQEAAAFASLNTGVDKCNEMKSVFKKELEQAQEFHERIKADILAWNEYRKKVVRLLDEIEDAPRWMRNRARDALRETLESFGESIESEPGSNLCIVCLERSKEIVFKCGHQCCKECSDKITNCHTCRKRISTRIKLYD